MVKVKNLNNTSGKQPLGYDTWLDFWEGKTGKTANHCGATDCDVKGRDNLVGAHVKKVGVGDDRHYISMRPNLGPHCLKGLVVTSL